MNSHSGSHNVFQLEKCWIQDFFTQFLQCLDKSDEGLFIMPKTQLVFTSLKSTMSNVENLFEINNTDTRTRLSTSLWRLSC